MTRNTKLLLITLLFSTSSVAQTIQWDSIDVNGGHEVSARINGLNMGAYSLGYINQMVDSISTFDECVQCIDFDCSNQLEQEFFENVVGFENMVPRQKFTQALSKISPSTLRFPGGTQAAWYHFYDYNDEGLYDPTNPIPAKGFGMNIGETIFLNDPYTHCQRDSRLLSQRNFMDAFTNLIHAVQNETGEQIRISYVANLLTHFRFRPVQLPIIGSCTSTCGRGIAKRPMSNYDCKGNFNIPYEGNEDLFDNQIEKYRFELYYKETQDAIDTIAHRLQLDSLDVFYVELGNEYYFNSNGGTYSFIDYGMSVTEYTEIAEIYAERLKCYFSGKLDIRIALASEPGSSWQKTNNIFNENFPGLEEDIYNDFTNDNTSLFESIDAIVLHRYYSGSDCLELVDISERFECVKSSLRNHIDIVLEEDVENFKNAFPGKDIWCTEYNIVGGMNPKNMGFINTILHSSFILEHALKFHELESELQIKIPMATHHRLGFDQPWSVIQTREGDNDFVAERVGAFTLSILNKLKEGNKPRFLGSILLDDGDSFDKSNVFSSAYSQELTDSTSKLLIYFSNKEEIDIVFDLADKINGYSIDGAQVHLQSGENLFSYGNSNGTFGANRYIDSVQSFSDDELNNLGYGNIHMQITDTMIVLDAEETVSLPKYSVGLIEMNLTDISISTLDLESKNLADINPNPVSDVLTINMNSNSAQEYTLRLFDANGQLIKNHSLKSTQSSIDLSDMTSGFYFVQIANGEYYQVKKVIKL